MKERVEKSVSVPEGSNLPQGKATRERSKFLLQGREDNRHMPE
jgi:hypothetical protein